MHKDRWLLVTYKGEPVKHKILAKHRPMDPDYTYRRIGPGDSMSCRICYPWSGVMDERKAPMA